jgi:hypothetical protein
LSSAFAKFDFESTRDSVRYWGIGLGVVAAVIGMVAVRIAGLQRSLEMELDEVGETLSDRAAVSDTFREIALPCSSPARICTMRSNDGDPTQLARGHDVDRPRSSCSERWVSYRPPRIDLCRWRERLAGSGRLISASCSWLRRSNSAWSMRITSPEPLVT